MNSNDSFSMPRIGAEQPAEVGVLLSQVKPEKVEWLWDKRIPLGKLTLLEGDPDHGKSLITMDLAARVTRGKAFPGEDVGHLEHLDKVDNLPGGVVVLNAEDGLADTIKPRLIASGADTTRVLALSAINTDGTLFGIPKDISTLERAIESVDARLAIVDPLSVFMNGDPNKDNEVRKALWNYPEVADSLRLRHRNLLRRLHCSVFVL